MELMCIALKGLLLFADFVLLDRIKSGHYSDFCVEAANQVRTKSRLELDLYVYINIKNFVLHVAMLHGQRIDNK